MSEKEIESSILTYLRSINIFCWKVNNVGIWDQSRRRYRKASSHFVIKGISDIIGIINIGPFKGLMLCIEVKRPRTRNNVSVEQNEFISKIRESGGIAFVATSIEDVKRELSEEGVFNLQ